MLRLCVQNVCARSKPIYQSFVLQEISNLKYIRKCSIINRNYATESTNDGTPESIYYGTLTPQIKAVKVFSLSSSLAGLLAQPIIIREAASIGSTSLIVALCSVVGFFTFVTPFLLHLITKKYVTEMHYIPETATYRATTISFFLWKKQLDFKVEDVEVPDIPGMFTTLHAKGKPLFVEARHFNNPLYYAKIMGYDKPMNFKLGNGMDADSETRTNTK